MRLFIAIELEEKLKQELKRVQDLLKEKAGPGLSFSNPEQFHLTIKFLGEVADHKTAAIIEKMPLISKNVPPFVLQLSSIGCFQAKNLPRVIWAGIKEAGEGRTLQTLWEHCEKELSVLSLKPENRSFSPHITLARVRVPAAGIKVREILGRLNIKAYKQPVASFVLFKSVLSPRSAVHTVIHKQILG